MPSLKDFEKKAKAKKQGHAKAHSEEIEPSTKSAGDKKNRRRPGLNNGEAVEAHADGHYRHGSEPEIESQTDAEYIETAHHQTSAAESKVHTSHESHQKEGTHTSGEKDEKFHLEFYGSELLRTKAPQVFDLAEAVVEDWQKDGDFKALPLKNPWAQMAAAEGLKRAKKVEQKLEEKGVIPMAKMGFEFLKSKLKK